MKTGIVVAYMFGLLATGAGLAMAAHGSKTLPLRGTLPATWKGTKCPPGTPLMSENSLVPCYLTTAHGTLPGLGNVADRRIIVILHRTTQCQKIKFTTIALTVGTRGTIDATGATHRCAREQDDVTVVPFAITGGTGAFTGATGSGTITISDAHETGHGYGAENETWKARLTLPG